MRVLSAALLRKALYKTHIALTKKPATKAQPILYQGVKYSYVDKNPAYVSLFMKVTGHVVKYRAPAQEPVRKWKHKMPY